MRNRLFLLLGAALLIVVGLVAAIPLLNRAQVRGATDIYASPVQAGCYIAAVNDCRIHVDPFTIAVSTTATKLSFFHLVAIQGGTGIQTMIYDFHTDLSNPVPFLGTTYSPSLVAQDYAATCGKSYQLSLQGKDLGDTSTFNLGLTSTFTCPSSVP